MKLSLIFEAQTVDTSPEAGLRMFHDIVDQCLLAEAMGFDVVWAVEHTALPQYAHMSGPETFLAGRARLRGQRFFVETLAHWYKAGPLPCVDDLEASEHEAALNRMSSARLSSETITTGHRYVSSSVAEDAYGTVDNCIPLSRT